MAQWLREFTILPEAMRVQFPTPTSIRKLTLSVPVTPTPGDPILFWGTHMIYTHTDDQTYTHIKNIFKKN